ncbi:hypothetical protein CKM354_000079900 [Cercospora kikuchii]|uniref:G domain-containing protein n=1 Tax=Cercospora kikuchii TaxID=84275 RepID=A0A9P3FC08_9PEZI|nr:uncharacterized protein CKM354_000079900 [Cercospora kikuchii]GIZ37349.1 hypothetical protein CKM354_000079900 [Cercospora kikuchii]
MGVTGAGKSTFISQCTESKDVKIGHSLQACTQKVEFFPVPWTKEATVYLIDTPGFDDTNKSDTEVLKEIAASLASLYDARIKLSGIIYLHQISLNRLLGSAKRNLFMFQKLCGENALRSVILATTMWDKVSKATGEKHENELKSTYDFWGIMIEKGSTVHRHDGSRESALNLVQHVAQMEPVVVDLQKELVEGKLPLNETGAGQEVDGGLTQARQQAEKQVKALQEELEEARDSHDERTEAALEEQKEDMERRIERILQQQQDLKTSLEKIYEEKEARMREELKLERDRRLEIEAKLMDADTKHEKQRHKHDATVKQYESKLADMVKNPLVRAAAGPSKIGRWTVSMTMFGSLYWFDASVNDFGTPLPDMPKARRPHPNPNGNRCVAFGERNSWYINYRHFEEGLESFTDHSIFSENFSTIYPDAFTRLNGDEGKEAPICISLAMGGYFFVRTASGVTSRLPKSALNRLKSKPEEWQSVWLGENGAFVAQRQSKDRSSGYETVMDLDGYDPFLQNCITAKQLKIVAMTLDPTDSKRWAVVWMDGTTIYSREHVPFQPLIFENFCSLNFGTQWTGRLGDSYGEAAEEMPMELMMIERGRRRILMPWKRKEAKVALVSKDHTGVSLRRFLA